MGCKRTLFLLYIFFILHLCAYCQQLSVSLSTLTPKTYEPVDLVFSFSNMNASRIVMPEVKGMKVVGGPAEYSNKTTVNGKTAGRTDIIYQVIFTKTGKLIFPAMSVNSGNKKIKSNSLNIEVAKGTNPFPPGYEGKEALIVLQESKKEAFLGECLSLDVILYSLSNRVSITGFVPPDFNDGWVQDMKGPEEDRFIEDRYQGRSYFRLDFAKIWLIPFKSGEVAYNPVRMVFALHVPLKQNNESQDPFGFVYSQSEIKLPFDVKTNPVIFHIHDLPEENKPESFVNALGEFTSKVSIDKTNAKANEPVKLKYTISGTGNFPILDGPPLNLPDGFEVFEPKVKNNFHVLQDGITGEKEFEYYIIPRKEGEFQLGPFAFSYFDVSKKKYVEIFSDSFRLGIKGMIADTTNGNKVVNNGIFTGENPYKKSVPFFGNPIYYFLLGLPLLIGIGLILFRKKIFFTRRDLSEKLVKQAENRANRSLAEAMVVLNSGNMKDALEQLSAIYFQYIGDKFKVARNEITRPNLEKWMPDQPITKLASGIMDQLDQFRFAPAAKSDLSTLFTDIKRLVNELGEKG